MDEEQSALQLSAECTSLPSCIADGLHELTRVDSVEKPNGNITTSGHSSLSTEGRFVAVTQYVNRYTDIQNLLRQHLIGSSSSELSKRIRILEKKTFESNSKLDSDTCAASQTEYPDRYLEKVICAKKPHLTSDQSSDSVTDGFTVSTENTSLEHGKLHCKSPLTSGGVDATDGCTEYNKDLMKKLQSNYMIVGLHACGDLTPNTLRLFVEQSQASNLCHVGCCYHHLSEAFIRNPYGKDGKCSI